MSLIVSQTPRAPSATRGGRRSSYGPAGALRDWRIAGVAFIALLLAALALPVPATCQALRGVVLEEGSRTPIAGATVELAPQQRAGDARRSSTDSLGAFHIQLRQSGLFMLGVSHPSYREVADTVQVSATEEVVVEVTLARAAIPLQPLVVTARARDPFGGFYARSEHPGFGHFLTREEIELRPGFQVTRLLEEMPGVRILRMPRASGIVTSLIATRGGAVGQCIPLIYVDGMPFRQLEDSGVDDFLTPQMLEGVEVYPSMAGVPGQFMSLNACGVVAFWTRNDGRGKWSWSKLAIGVGGFLIAVLLARW